MSIRLDGQYLKIIVAISILSHDGGSLGKVGAESARVIEVVVRIDEVSKVCQE